MSRIALNNKSVERIMTISGINLYSASAVTSKIDNVSGFATKEIPTYTGLVPRQDQSSNRDIRGHITKHGPSMLRFILVNAAYIVIKHSKRLKSKYLSIVRRIGKKRAIVAIARILIEMIYTMLKKDEDFVDEIDALTERKMNSMRVRAENPSLIKKLDEVINFVKKKMIRDWPNELFS